MEMRTRVRTFVPVHPDRDPIEETDPRHSPNPKDRQVRSRSQLDPEAALTFQPARWLDHLAYQTFLWRTVAGRRDCITLRAQALGPQRVGLLDELLVGKA